MREGLKFFMPLAAVFMMAACGDDINGVDPQPDPQPEPPVVSAAHAVAVMDITTENGAPIKGKDKEHYVNCTITVDHPDDQWDYTGTGRIRERGNSTWEWYDKKPYRIKLDEKASIVGLAAEKDWVLLANYRDPSNIMNTFVFELGHVMGMPYTNHSRYMEVTLNGEYIGLYQLTEQIEQGKNRVAVDDAEGVLISLDADDGPEHSPRAKDNFWSDVYGLPVCVKYPEDLQTAGLDAVREDLARLEEAIYAIRKRTGTLDAVNELMDVQSFIDFLIIQELVYNVELAAPRSMYMHKDKGGRWVMGPLWDFDAGFDFDWGYMYDGHNYFATHKELVLGTDPIHHTGGYWVPEFFTDIFRSNEFREMYRNRWDEISPLILTTVWENTQKYIDAAEEAMGRNAQRWPIYAPSDNIRHEELDFQVEIVELYTWLEKRIAYLTPIIHKYKE